MNAQTIRKRRKKPVTVPAMPTSWDAGAEGPANRDRLRKEPATEFDPATGKETANPNGIERYRRETWVAKYARKGKLTKQQAAAAEALFYAASGFPNRDPLAAIVCRVDGKSDDDPLVSKVDRRRAFYRLWKQIPDRCKPFVEHVVINDLSIRSMNGCINGQAEERYMRRLCQGLDAIC